MTSTSRRARLVVAYDGSRFHGFAPNPDVPTVASALTEALEKITQSEVQLVAAGRTDAGVHARGQVVSVDLPSRTKIESLARKLNALCGPQIAVRDVQWAPASFHARFSAIWRHYRYTVLNSKMPDPFLATTAWHIHVPLELRAMQLASDAIMGERDFSAFCRKPADAAADDADESIAADPGAAPQRKARPAKKPATMTRFVTQAAWKREGEIVTFEVRANAFCHQMVRSLVGTFVDIGLGKRPPSDMMNLIRGGRRHDTSQLAPPHGLCLWEVGYPSSLE
ncbi:MAG: tRNA pseudouridine synthase A [Actinomycetota bacterium]